MRVLILGEQGPGDECDERRNIAIEIEHEFGLRVFAYRGGDRFARLFLLMAFQNVQSLQT